MFVPWCISILFKWNNNIKSYIGLKNYTIELKSYFHRMCYKNSSLIVSTILFWWGRSNYCIKWPPEFDFLPWSLKLFPAPFLELKFFYNQTSTHSSTIYLPNKKNVISLPESRPFWMEGFITVGSVIWKIPQLNDLKHFSLSKILTIQFTQITTWIMPWKQRLPGSIRHSINRPRLST